MDDGRVLLCGYGGVCADGQAVVGVRRLKVWEQTMHKDECEDGMPPEATSCDKSHLPFLM